MTFKKKITAFNSEKTAQIDDETIQKINKRGHLSLDDNNMKKFREDLFTNLTKLKKLTLNENKIKSLNENVFSSLTSLEILRLKNNLIKLTWGNYGTGANRNIPII